MTSIAPPRTDLPVRIPSFISRISVCSDKSEPSFRAPLRELWKYLYWEPNGSGATWVLAVDVDDSIALLRVYETITEHKLPSPNWVIERASNGHAQLAYVIHNVSHAANARQAPQDYARDVRAQLTQAFAGDRAFSNARMWNPLYEGWSSIGQVFWGPNHTYDLGELRSALRTAGLWQKTPQTRSTALTGPLTASEGRNVALFEYLRKMPSQRLQELATAANSTFPVPLPPAEVRGIVRSIERYRAKRGTAANNGTMSDKQINVQRTLGAKGGSVNSAAQQEARAKGPAASRVVRSAEAIGRAAQIRDLASQGWSHTRIADQLNVSESTVKRALKNGR